MILKATYSQNDTMWKCNGILNVTPSPRAPLPGRRRTTGAWRAPCLRCGWRSVPAGLVWLSTSGRWWLPSFSPTVTSVKPKAGVFVRWWFKDLHFFMFFFFNECWYNNHLVDGCQLNQLTDPRAHHLRIKPKPDICVKDWIQLFYSDSDCIHISNIVGDCCQVKGSTSNHSQAKGKYDNLDF